MIPGSRDVVDGAPSLSRKSNPAKWINRRRHATPSWVPFNVDLVCRIEAFFFHITTRP